MSSHQGRALTLPFSWERDKQRVRTIPETRSALVPSDEEVMARLQSKDTDALNILLDRYRRLLFSIALRILNDRCEAEEIVQESFFHVYQHAGIFDPARGSARAWIVQIAYNRALDRRAHLSRRGFYCGTNLGALDDTVLGAADMEREVEARLNWKHLERAFEELTEAQRRTLELFYFEGMELREISAKLSEPLGNVRHHFYRGLERLRRSALLEGLQEK